jgi:hypothetical protein
MGCPGLHCPGCTGKQSAAAVVVVLVLVVVADELVPWVAARIWWIGGTLALCFALAVAASMYLERWADIRGARFAQRHGIRSRADVMLPESVRAVVVEAVPERPAIAPAPHVVVNVFGQLGTEQAEVIRRALGQPD